MWAIFCHQMEIIYGRSGMAGPDRMDDMKWPKHPLCISCCTTFSFPPCNKTPWAVLKIGWHMEADKHLSSQMGLHVLNSPRGRSNVWAYWKMVLLEMHSLEWMCYLLLKLLFIWRCFIFFYFTLHETLLLIHELISNPKECIHGTMLIEFPAIIISSYPELGSLTDR